MAKDEQQHRTPAGMGDNSRAALIQLAARVKRNTGKEQSATLTTLKLYRDSGEALNEAKSMLTGRGEFVRWCNRSGFTFSKSWRARMMQLATHYDAMVAAMEKLPQVKRSWKLDDVIAQWREANSASSDEAPRPRKPVKAVELRAANADLTARCAKMARDIEWLKETAVDTFVAGIEGQGGRVALPDGRTIVILPATEAA